MYDKIHYKLKKKNKIKIIPLGKKKKKEKVMEPETKLETSIESEKKQGSSRKHLLLFH